MCVFDSSWWIVSGAFGWWDNCFQSSLWSNCASSTQKPYLPLRICCPPLLKRFLGQRDRPNYSLPERETLRNSSGLGGVTDCMARTRVCLISYALYVSLSVCVCVNALCVSTCMCVFSHLALISEQEKLPEWLWGNCPQLHIQTHVVSPKIRQGPGFTFQTSTSDRGQTMWKLSRNGPVAAYTCTRGLKVFLWF